MFAHNFADDSSVTIAGCYSAVRNYTETLCEPLVVEDYCMQLMEDASPPKWHLAHVTWFFETFILAKIASYKSYHPMYEVLFNSYYQGVGKIWPRASRGHLSRPTTEEVMEYRAFVDRHMLELLSGNISEETRQLTVLGLHHEQQHQELLLTDIKYNLAHNPLMPRYRDRPAQKSVHTPLEWLGFSDGLKDIGCDPRMSSEYSGFVYDNETPRHRVYLRPYQLASRLVTNGEYFEFIAERGYRRPEFWLSDGWDQLLKANWRYPLYWFDKNEEPFGATPPQASAPPSIEDFREYHLNGLIKLDPDAPVAHISFYEADAYARWKGCRLPSEAEWEAAVVDQSNLFPEYPEEPEPPTLQPLNRGNGGFDQCFHCLWQWTASSYSPYPGFKPFSGSISEYNGKFMCSQQVLRGSSLATPAGHARPAYRNFFYPESRWQFSGIRLAKDQDA